MLTLQEALAREHIRQLHTEARNSELVGNLASARRWRYLERRAHEFSRRRAHRAAQLSSPGE